MSDIKQQSNFLDRAIGYFAPGIQAQREYSRLKIALTQRAYDAASYSRRTAGWQATGNSVNAENLNALPTLRNRSRELARNTTAAKKALQSIANNVVGTGIRPTPLVITNFAESAKNDNALTDKLKVLWKLWAEETTCHHTEQLNFYGLQKLTMRCVAESGEALIIRRRNPKSLIPFAIEILEPDYLDRTRNVSTITGGGCVLDGVEFDKNGKAVAYWLYEQHPGEAVLSNLRGINSRRVPTTDVIRVYEILRPGQISGIPFGTSAMLKLRDMDDYDDAELVKQKIAACFAAFVHDSTGGDNLPSTTDAVTGALTDRMEPGTIQHLPAGKEITFGTPPSKEGYAEYKRVNEHSVAAGYGTTYEAMTGDLSQVNFSSAQLGKLESELNYETWQEDLLITMLCKPVYAWFVEAVQIAGYIRLADNQIVRSTWTAPARKTIDGVKAMKATTGAVRSGLLSWRDAVKQQGYDPDELLKELSEDKKRFDTLGLMLDVDASLDYLEKKKPTPKGE